MALLTTASEYLELGSCCMPYVASDLDAQMHDYLPRASTASLEAQLDACGVGKPVDG
jgi:hypothetical protein